MPVKVDELDYRREKKMPRKPGPTPEHFTPSKMINASSVANIQDHLKKVCEESHPGALFLTLVNDPPVAQSPVVVPSVKDLYQQYQASSQDGSFVDYLAANTTDEHVEALRNLKQSDPAWFKAREGRITASNADSVRSARDINKCTSLLDKISGKNQSFTSKAVEFGKTHEAIARQLYRETESPKHTDFELEECGLLLDKNAPFMGASPDGIISCKCHGQKLLEIKCSYKHRDISPEDIPENAPSYHLQRMDGRLNLKKTSPWYSQVQFQMGVTNISTCDLLLYTCKGIVIITLQFDEERWVLLKEKAELVFLHSVSHSPEG